MKRISPKTWCWLAATLAVVAVMLLAPEWLWARAGGGGGYSGGGGGFSGGGGGFSSSGGSGSGGNGLGLLIYWLIQLCINRPLIGVPLVIGIIALFYFGARNGQHHRVSRTIQRGRAAMADHERAAAVGLLGRDDPDFNEERFYDRVRHGFVQVQQAWCSQDMQPVRAFISDGILERFTLQIQEQRERDYRDHMEQIVVNRVALAKADSNEYFDEITVMIAASAIDYRMSLSKGKRLSGSILSESFVEYWTFLRRHGVRTTDKPGLIEGSCPNCGADIRLNQSARCPACDSVLRSGQYDWVLTEITQASEWNGDDRQRVVNLDWYRAQADAALQLRHLEDRTSVIFWRKAAADRAGDVRPLTKMATTEFCEQYASGFRRDSRDGDARQFWGECAVGSVDVLALLPAAIGNAASANASANGNGRDHSAELDGAGMDRALIEVRWSGTKHSLDPRQGLRALGDSSAFRTMFVLSRRQGARTNVDQTIASAHCPNCGAPETNVASHGCEFCGETLNDGSHDWVLTAIHPMNSAEAHELIRQAREHAQSNVQDVATLTDRPPQASQQLAWAIKMALADNELDEREMKMLQRAAAHRRVDHEWLDAMIEAARRDQLDVPMPPDRAAARQWLTSMADVSLWDGRISESELRLLCQAGAAYDYSAYDVKQLVRERRARIYRQAREQLRSRS
ncbi:MAG: TIM44-like domain-containing protein [Planctomycetales bacterium]|nr:TIM44-like domain-containing protein [Planctomycetales bacterium]